MCIVTDIFITVYQLYSVSRKGFYPPDHSTALIFHRIVDVRNEHCMCELISDLVNTRQISEQIGDGSGGPRFAT